MATTDPSVEMKLDANLVSCEKIHAMIGAPGTTVVCIFFLSIPDRVGTLLAVLMICARSSLDSSTFTRLRMERCGRQTAKLVMGS